MLGKKKAAEKLAFLAQLEMPKMENKRSLTLHVGFAFKGPSKRLQHCFNIHSILLNAVGRLLNDVERWDEQTLSTFHSTKLSEGPGNLFQAPALFTPETYKGAILK